MIEIKQIAKLDAEVFIPGSKSYTNRALIIAALAEGKSVLRNVLVSDDTKYMVNALQEFGIKIEEKENSFIVYGTGGKLKKPAKEIYVGNAGTTMRFLTTFAALAKGEITINGDKRMQERPIGGLINALYNLGVKAESNNNHPPIKIFGGSLKGGKTKINGNISSQFLTSILLCAPYAEKDVELEVVGDLTSKSYVDISLDVMKSFGVKVQNDSYKIFKIKKKKYQPKEYLIEGDLSSASYFFAAAAITKGKIKVKNINPNSVQGDVCFVDLLKKMGCEVIKEKDSIEVIGKDLYGITADMNNMPDTVQTLAVVAAFAKGKTVIKNIYNLRVKETDRINALESELKKIGIKVEATRDIITIYGGTAKGSEIETYNDHRMAMSFAIVGLKIPGIIIKNPECVTKSFPEFWDKLKEIY